MANITLFVLPLLLKLGVMVFALGFGGATWRDIVYSLDSICALAPIFFFAFLLLLRATSKQKKDESEHSIRILLGISLWVWVLYPFAFILLMRP